jgi:signal transduction histidine kinase
MNLEDQSSNCDYVIRAHQLCVDLIDIMMLINSSHDADKILHIVVEGSCKALGCESARIAMREGDDWVVRYTNKLQDDLLGRSFTDKELPHAALAMTTQKPVAIDDALHDDRTNAELMKSLGIKSVLVLPLMERHEVTGTMFFDYRSKAVSFTAAEIDFAGKMTTWVAIALQNARQYQELAESKRLGDALNEIDDVLFSTKDSGVIINKMLQLATDVIGAETAVIFSKEGDRWAARYVYKLSESLIGQDFSNTEVMHTAITAETKRSIVIQDVLDSPEIDQKFVEMLGIRSLLDFPLIMNGEVIGDLTFHYHSSAVPFNERQVEFARKLQISISLALENSRLHVATETAIAASKQAAAATKELEQRVYERTALLQRQTEELEQANERLKEVDHLKSRFIASMSHELRTPLNAVIGFSSVLLNEWVGPANTEQKQNLASILRSGRHLLNMINDILDVSQIEAGTITPVIKEFDLYDLLTEAENQVTATMREKGLELRSEPLRQRMRTDRRRLLKCVLNLLNNAAKFTDKGGVTVAARIVPFTGEAPEEEMVEIAITDTGIGIGAEDLLRISQPFNRIVIPQRAIVPGTGLGLFLTRKIAQEILKGDLLVSSEYGKGSRFSLRIPVRLP